MNANGGMTTAFQSIAGEQPHFHAGCSPSYGRGYAMIKETV